MENSTYTHLKGLLIEEAREAKRLNSHDKPYIRQVINDYADELRKRLDWYAMKDRISEKQAELYKNWLSNLAGRLHP